MARFKPPPLARPPVDGQMRGEYGDAVDGVTGPFASRYLARLWFGSTQVERVFLEVYSVQGQVQVWADAGQVIKAEAISKRGKAYMDGMKAMIAKGLTVDVLRAGAGDGAVVKLRDEVKEMSIAKASLRRNVWKAAHRVAATCLHGIDDAVHVAGVPLAGDDVLDVRDSFRITNEEGDWWGHLTDWARWWIAMECMRTIRWMLDSETWPIARWLDHFATFDWRGRAHGYQLRPERGRGKRSCFDVLGEDWIKPGSNLVIRAEKRANVPNPQFPNRKPRPWVK